MKAAQYFAMKFRMLFRIKGVTQRGCLVFRILMVCYLYLVASGASADIPEPNCTAKITFDGYTRNEALNDFPVLILLGDHISGFMYRDFISPSDGADLRFFNEDQSQELNYEVESWNTNGTSYVWVQVDQLTNGSCIYAAWGNTNWSVAPASTTNGATWDSSYEAVWHLNETVMAGVTNLGVHKDATSHQRNGDHVGNVNVAGKVADGQYWDGTNDYIGVTASIVSTADLTIAAWMKVDSVTNWGAVINHDGWTSGNIHYQFPGTNLALAYNQHTNINVSFTNYTFPVGEWHHVVAAYDRSAGSTNGIFRFYIDGELNQTVEHLDTSLNPSPTPGHIGSWELSRYFHGAMDEFRILQSVPSSNWIWATWHNMASNDQFNSYGTALHKPARYYVDASRPDDSGDGLTWGTAKRTIQAAVDIASPGYVVLVTNGLYNEGTRVTPGYSTSNRVCITSAITVRSLNGADVTVIEGNAGSNGTNDEDSVRGVYMNGGACTLSGFTIRDGYTRADGDSLYDKRGGGCWAYGSALVTDCKIINCQASSEGGGIALLYGATMENSLVVSNTAGNGGGVFIYYGGYAKNCLVKENTGFWAGGGCYMYSGGSAFINCTVIGNYSPLGGGIRFVSGGAAYNCIFRLNGSYNISNVGGALYNTCSPDGVTHGVDGCITSDPLFVDEATGNYRLQYESPCLNAGNNAYAPTNTMPYDLDGDARTMFSAVDMGAYEIQTMFSTNEGPSTGGNTLIVTNGALGSGVDITNVVVCGSQATIVDQGVNWVEVTLGVSTDQRMKITGDIVLQSASVGNTIYSNRYTYHRLPGQYTFYVDANRPDDSGNGLSWTNAKKTIQGAVDLTYDGDLICVTNGVYDKGGAVTPGYTGTNRLCITNAVSVYSVNGPGVTFISGASGSNGSNDLDSIRGVYMSGGCTLRGFTVTNGYTLNSGDSTFDQTGGALWLATNCVAVNCVLKDNMANHHGAGAFLQPGAAMDNCLISDGTAHVHGGGVFLNGGGTLNNCSVYGNRANNSGGGVALVSGGTVNNSILWGNTAADTGNDIFKWTTGMMVSNSCASDGVTPGVDGCITSNPLFRDAVGGDYQLQVLSPCLNTGNNVYAPTNETLYDLAGKARIVFDTVDMGAYELQALLSTNSGPATGGNTIIVSNGVLGSGADITNVTVCGAQAAIVDQGVNWVEITLGASTNPHHQITGDVLVQSVSIGDRLFVDVYTYEKGSGLTYYVDASRPDDSGDGSSWAQAKKTIQAAIDLTVDYETVLVTNGMYDENGLVTPGYAATNRVCITKPIAVRSVNGPDVTIIAGAPGLNGGCDTNAIRGVFMTNSCVLSGFTVTNSYTLISGHTDLDRSGGGIWMATNCIVSNCVLTGNAAYGKGGGVFMHYGGIMSDCVFITNSCGTGGGIYFNYGGELNNSILTCNGSTYGGAIFANYGGLINNCLISHNTANNGGGVYCWGAGSILNNITVVTNLSKSSGGGVYMQSGGELNNAIVWGNDSWGQGDDIYRWLSGMAVRYTCASDGVTNGTDGCITNDPKLVIGGVSNWHLQASSRCINAGDNMYAPTNVTPYDLAGNVRIQQDIVDMGAYESPFAPGQYCVLTITSAWGTASPTAGSHEYEKGTIITNSIGPESIALGTTQFVCSGWQLVGNDPLSGGATNFVMTLTNDASLTWTWETGYYLTTTSNPNGYVDVSSGWYTNGANVEITATADPCYYFASWTGDYPPGSFLSNPVVIHMDRAKQVKAYFYEIYTTNTPIAVPATWLGKYGLTNFDVDAMSDLDGDGQLTWEEYITAETDPTNPASFFYTGISQGSMVIYWPSAEGRYYTVEQLQNLNGSWITNQLWSEVEGRPPMNTVTNPTSAMTNDFEFFRVKVEYGGGD